MNKNATIFSHADADGHIIAVQSYRNLTKDGFRIEQIIVDPKITKNSKFWVDHFRTADFGNSDHIYILDIMFDRSNPMSSLKALFDRAAAEPAREFIVIDHHPIDLPPDVPGNVSIPVVESVFNCCYGEPSELMYLAAICDKEASKVKDYINPWHLKIAKGIKRAVTERDYIAGQVLLALIQEERWSVFERLADEPLELHKTMYGYRTSKATESPTITRIKQNTPLTALCAG